MSKVVKIYHVRLSDGAGMLPLRIKAAEVRLSDTWAIFRDEKGNTLKAISAKLVQEITEVEESSSGE